MRLFGKVEHPQDAASKGYVDRYVNVVIDFGAPAEDSTAYAGALAPWVSTARPIVCVPHPVGTVDHGAEDFIVEGLSVAVVLVVPGVGFILSALAPAGTWGQYLISCIG